VKEAAKIGYRHIDTAQAYQNERGVGEGIRASGVKREEMFVTTKLAAEVKSYQEAVAAIDQSLKTMGLDYIDMMIIHSPKPWTEFHKDESFFAGNREAWRALEEAYKVGVFRILKKKTSTTSSNLAMSSQWSTRFWRISAIPRMN